MCCMSCVLLQVWCFTCHMSSVRCNMAYFLVFRCASISSSDDCHSLTDWLNHSLADWKWSYTTSVLIIDIEIVTEFTKYTERSLRGKCYQNWNGQKLILEEKKVNRKSWSLVLISTDMGSVVSPWWDNDHPKKLVIPNSVVCQHLVDVIQFCRFWERLTSFIHACLETLEFS